MKSNLGAMNGLRAGFIGSARVDTYVESAGAVVARLRCPIGCTRPPLLPDVAPQTHRGSNAGYMISPTPRDAGHRWSGRGGHAGHPRTAEPEELDDERTAARGLQPSRELRRGVAAPGRRTGRRDGRGDGGNARHGGRVRGDARARP